MKKLILIVCLMLSTIGLLSAQENDTIYVIFTSTRNDYSGVWHFTRDYYNPEFYRSPSHDFTIMDRSKGYFFRFAYVNSNNKPDKPIISKPVSFLETIYYIDWDIIGPTLTKEQAKEKYQEIIFYPKILKNRRTDESSNIR